jgi:hypothetical protein
MLSSIDKARFDKMYRYFTRKLDYFEGRCRIWEIGFDPAAARDRSIWALECRLAADKLAASGDSLEDPVWRTLSRALKACISAEQPVSDRIIRAAWLLSVAVSPRAFARRLIGLRFLVLERPAWFERVLNTIVAINGWRGSSRREAISRRL